MEITIKTMEFKGKKYVDVRKYYRDKNSNEMAPTKKGIAIPVGELSDVINKLEAAEADLAKGQS